MGSHIDVMVYIRSNISQAVSMVYRSGKDSLAWNYVDSLIWVWDNLWRHFLSGILKYGWLDPSSWVYRQSNWHNHFESLINDYFGDDDSLVVGSYLCKSSPRCRIVENSKVKGGSHVGSFWMHWIRMPFLTKTDNLDYYSCVHDLSKMKNSIAIFQDFLPLIS